MTVPVPVYGCVPPVPMTVTVELSPLQRIGVAVHCATSRGGSGMKSGATAMHPFASVTVKFV